MECKSIVTTLKSEMRLSIGALLTEHISRRYCIDKLKCNRLLVLIVTFFVYVVFRMSRRPISIVKSELHQNCSSKAAQTHVNVDHRNDSKWCDWEPFDGDNAVSLLGWLDTSLLLTYAFAMFLAGYAAERCNLRYFLTISLIACGVMVILFGIAYPLHIHNYWYYIVIQILTGIFEATGWPAVVTAVGNWFGSAKKGLIFGIWSWHTNIGNIVGSAIAGNFLTSSFYILFTIQNMS